MRIVVVFPEPLGPRNPCTSPVETARFNPSRALVWPKLLTRLETEIVLTTFPRYARLFLKANYGAVSSTSDSTLSKRRNLRKVLAHQWLLRRVWGPAYRPESECLRTFIRQLRQKVGDDPSAPQYIPIFKGTVRRERPISTGRLEISCYSLIRGRAFFYPKIESSILSGPTRG